MFQFKIGLKGKILSMALIALSAFILLGIVATFFLFQMKDRVELLGNQRIEITKQIGEIKAASNGIPRFMWLALALKPNSEERLKALANVEKNSNQLTSSLEMLNQYKLRPQVIAKIESMKTTFSKLKEIIVVGKTKISANSPAEDELAKELLIKEMPPFALKLTKESIELSDFVAAINQEVIKEAESHANLSLKILFSFSLIAGILILVYSYTLSSRVSKSLAKASDGLMHESNELRSSVSQILAVSHDLASISTEQAAVTQETSSAVEEISATIQRSSDTAKKSEEMSLDSKAKALDGNQIVAKMALSMDKIKDSNAAVIDAVNDNINKMEDVAKIIKEIGLKTNVINDIVFQTKLLSFNASVEAARAGEMGKGFAVVAEEVGNLAQMSGNAAKDISTLIEASTEQVQQIANQTKSTVGNLVDSAQKVVAEGVQIVKECEIVLGDLVHSSESVANSVSTIAHASQEQATGANEIARAMHEIDKTTQMSSSTAELCATTAEALSDNMKMLRNSSSVLAGIVTGRRIFPKIHWTDEYSLQLNDMDNDHKIIIEKMNRVIEKLETVSPTNTKPILQVFNDFLASAKDHFKEEEDFMQSFGYPNLKSHKEIHNQLLQKMDEYASLIKNGKMDADILVDFLHEWLSKHTLSADKKYSSFYRIQSTSVQEVGLSFSYT